MNSPTGFGGAERLRSHRTPTRAEIIPLVADELRQVEISFRENLASPVRIVDEIGEFVAQGEGKRIRPTLHLLCAKLCNYEGPHDILLGTVIEFIHCATLIHDDIIDEATVRRGRSSVNNRWGNNVSVLFGDYMFAKAMEMALRADSLSVMEKLAAVTLRMTEAEMLQTRYVGRIDLTVQEYLDLIEQKTAALFSCCCQLGGLLAGVGLERELALRRYGSHLGLVFQLVDDLLDFTGTVKTLGKPTATDLREGKATLAVLDLLASDRGRGRDLVRRVMSQGADEGPEIVELTELLQRSGAIERVRERARFHAVAAGQELERFEDNAARRALEALPYLLLHRER